MFHGVVDLYQIVEPSLLKLKRRLAKEGLREISEMEYSKYLRTVLWKKIKEWIQERDGYRCVVCGAEKSRFCELEVHHRSYDLDVLEGKRSEMLVTLCPHCHKLIEFNFDGSKKVCMEEKEKRYFELKKLHAEIESKGLPLLINNQSNKRGWKSYEIVYTGNNDYLQFYSVESLMFGFVLNFYHKYRDKLKIPLPFGRDKFYQKSGAKVSFMETGKEVINTKIVDGKPIIKVSKYCEFPALEHLSSYIEEQKYWHVTQ